MKTAILIESAKLFEINKCAIVKKEMSEEQKQIEQSRIIYWEI